MKRVTDRKTSSATLKSSLRDGLGRDDIFSCRNKSSGMAARKSSELHLQSLRYQITSFGLIWGIGKICTHSIRLNLPSKRLGTEPHNSLMKSSKQAGVRTFADGWTASPIGFTAPFAGRGGTR